MFDVIIIGAGPAGLTAALYSVRSGLKTKICEKMCAGGQVLLTECIDNFPGFPGGIEARKLAENIIKQVEELGLEIDDAQISQIKKDSFFTVKTQDNKEFQSKAIIVTTGAQYRHLDIPTEEKFRGRGVSYCAICDGPLFRNKDVAVIGGGNKAVEEALTLQRYAKRVVLIHRRDQLRATKSLQDKILNNKNIKIIWDTVPLEFQGGNCLKSIKIKNVKSQKEDILSIDGVFVSVGIKPNTDFLKGLLQLDEEGYIISDDDMKTSVDGIFAGGDCRKKSLHQIITACSEGAVCAYSAFKFIEKHS